VKVQGSLWWAAACAAALSACGPGTEGTPDAGVDGGVDEAYVPVQTSYDDLATAPKCNPEDPTQNCVEMSPEAVRVDDEAKLNWQNVRFDPTTKVMSFDLAPGTTLDPRVAAGKMLVRSGRGRPPLMARILEVSQSGQTVSLKMGPRLKTKDVFPRGRLRFRAPLGAEPSTLSQNQNGLSVLQSPLSLGSVGPSDCAGNIFNQSVSSSGVTGTVKVDLTKCKFRLGAYVDVSVDWYGSDAKIEAVLGGTLDAALHTKLTANLTGAYSQDKKLWELATPLVFSIGGVPFTLEVEVFAGYSLSGRANLTVEQGFDLNGSVEAGAGWKKNRSPQLYSVYRKEVNFTKFGPLVTFDGNVTAKAYVKPRVSLEALGIAGATASLKVFAEGQVTAHASSNTGSGSTTVAAQVCTDLYAGLTPSVGLVIDPDFIPFMDPIEAEYDLSTTKALVQGDVCVSTNATYYSNCDQTSECCTDSQCADDPYGFPVQCTKGSATSGGKYTYTCVADRPEGFCEKNSDCSDSTSVTVDACVDHECVFEPLNIAASPGDYAGLTGLDSATPAAVPAKCNVNSDCDDGKLSTRDTCKKALPNAGPAVAGTCQNTPLTAP